MPNTGIFALCVEKRSCGIPNCSSEKQEKQSHEHQTKHSGRRRYRPAGRRGCARTAVQGASRQGADPQAGRDAARQLTSAGIDVVTGDLGDAASVLKAASGLDAMFLMGNPYEA